MTRSLRPFAVETRSRSPRPHAPRPAPLRVVTGPSLDDILERVARIRQVTERLRRSPTTNPAEMVADRVLAANEIDRQLAKMVGVS